MIDAMALDDATRRLSPKSEIAKVIAYGRNRWIALIRYIVASAWNTELHHILLTAPQTMELQ